MCDPLSIATVATVAGISGGTAGIGLDAQEKSAEDQEDAVRAGAAAQGRQVAKRASQEAKSADLRRLEATDEARAALSTATVAAAEGGVGGEGSRVITTLARDIRRDRLKNIAAIDRNESAVQDQLITQQQGITAQANQRLAGINPGIGPIGILPALIGGASSGVGLLSGAQTLSGGTG